MRFRRRRREPRWPVYHSYIDPIFGTLYVRHRDGSKQWFNGPAEGRHPKSDDPPMQMEIMPRPPKRPWYFNYPREGVER